MIIKEEHKGFTNTLHFANSLDVIDCLNITAENKYKDKSQYSCIVLSVTKKNVQEIINHLQELVK